MVSGIKDLVIKDQKRTIERLQEELKDKSDFIFNLLNIIENLNKDNAYNSIIQIAGCEIKNDAKEPKTYNGYLKGEMQNKYYRGK